MYTFLCRVLFLCTGKCEESEKNIDTQTEGFFLKDLPTAGEYVAIISSTNSGLVGFISQNELKNPYIRFF